MMDTGFHSTIRECDENPIATTPFWMLFFTFALVITDYYGSSLNACIVNCKESTEGLLFWSWVVVFILVKIEWVGKAYQTFS